MGRPRKPIDATADAKAVRARLKVKDLEGWQRQRLQAAQLGLARVLSLPQIAEEVGVSPRTIGSWFKAFRQGGIEGLLTRKAKGSGPASWLDPESAAQFKAELDKGAWRRAQDARRWLEKKLGRKLTLIVTYKYLGKCAARLKVPRPTHRKKDPAKVEAFRAELCEKLHGQQIALETSVHLWVSDEMRFGLQPVTRRVWARRGIEAVLSVEPRYQWGYTYGALEVGGGGAEFLHTDGVSLEASRCFLDQVGQSAPEAIHIVIQDGAGFHQAEGALELPANVRVIQLPPYSPELNPIERLWDVIKDRICNRAWEDLEQLMAAINEVLTEYWTTPAKVRALIGDGWLLDTANASYPNVLAA
jgi:transposase